MLASEVNGARRSVPKDGLGHDIDLLPLRPLLDRILQRWRPIQVWLFGSRARGDARTASDWDVFVVMPDDTGQEFEDPLIGWQLRKESGVRADVIMCRASDFREDRTTPNTMAFEVARDGVLIYER